MVGPPAPLHPPPRTVWHGRQPPERVASMLESADLLLMPARYETYGVCYLEAMRAGTAIVASSLGTTRELVGDAGILVRPADVPGLAAVLTELVREPEPATGFDIDHRQVWPGLRFPPSRGCDRGC